MVIEQPAALTAEDHDRCRPGLNRLAFLGGSLKDVDRLASQARTHGSTLLFPDRHPQAGDAEHYAAYPEDGDGFEVELVGVRGGQLT